MVFRLLDVQYGISYVSIKKSVNLYEAEQLSYHARTQKITTLKLFYMNEKAHGEKF